MKTIKPLGLGVLCRTFENDRQCYFVASVLAFFPFDPAGVLLPEVNLWKLLSAELGEGVPFDEGMWKACGEVLVTGKAHPPGGLSQPACAVRLVLGEVDKKLFVVGDRQWQGRRHTDPIPFYEMPLDWAHAYGGDGYPANPLGKGHVPLKGEDGTLVHPLPNVEDPRQVVSSPKDRPPPAGLGAYDLSWPQRFGKVGTYDRKWLDERFPGLAEDIDWSFFNTAPEDQWIDGFFRGDETFRIEHMHPQKPVLEGRLPGVRARCFIGRQGDRDDRLEELDMRIDTVHLLPAHERGVVVFRGVAEVEEDDGADVKYLLLGAERMGEPRPTSHYRKVLAQRLDREKGHLYALRDSDLMPPRDPGLPPLPMEAYSDIEELTQREGLLEQNQRKRVELELEAARQQLLDAGVDPDDKLPQELPPPEQAPALENLAEYVDEQMGELEKAKAEYEKEKQQALDDIRLECEQAGLDYDKVLEEARQDQVGGPPTFSAAKELETLREQQQLARNAGVSLPHLDERLADPELEQKLRVAEDSLRDAYRRFAHHYPAARLPEADAAQRMRVEVVAARDAGESLAGRDLTGIDLSELDFGGADLQGTFLEGANLSGADLSGADLSGAVLARADLAGACLTKAKLVGANLGLAQLEGARFDGGVDLSEAVLAKAELSEATLAGARMVKADLSEAAFGTADLSGVHAPSLMLLDSDLSGLRLRGAALGKSVFVQCTVSGADFSEARLDDLVFLAVTGRQAVFRGAQGENLRLVHDCSFEGADFRGAVLTGANFRGTKLAGADFSEAQLDGADFSECDLCGASFHRASAKKAMFVRADLTNANMVAINLMEGIVQKAIVKAADFTGANLFRADFARIQGDEATSFEEANMKFIRFVDRGGSGKR